MKTSLYAVATALTLITASASAQTATPSTSPTAAPMTAMDAQEFVTMAASGGMYEIQSSEMLLEAGVDDAELQEFAQQMVTEHEAAAEALTAAAGDLTVPTELEPQHAAMLEELEASDDMAATYLEQQVMAHEESVALHQAYAESGEDADLQAYAEETLPTLEAHLEMVQGMQSAN